MRAGPTASECRSASSLPGGDAIAGADDALFSVNSGPQVRRAPETLTFAYSKDGLRIRKRFAFESEGHVVRVETEVTEGGRAQRHLIAWGGGFGDTAQAGNTVHSQTFYYDSGDIEYVPAADAEDEQLTHSGPYTFVGIADLFFTAAAIPEPGQDIRIETSAIEIVPAGAEPDEARDLRRGGVRRRNGKSLPAICGPEEPRRPG